MKKIEHFVLTVLFGSVIPISLFLVGWWGSLPYLKGEVVFQVAAAAFGCGVLVELFIFKRLQRSLWQFSTTTLILILVFYSICLFGFFMGVPAPNLLTGTLAGWFTGRQCAYQHLTLEQFSRKIRWVTDITTGILTLLCVISAWLALRDPFTAANLQGMLRLPFSPTAPMLWTLILFGGFGLIVMQWRLTFWAAKRAFVVP